MYVDKRLRGVQAVQTLSRTEFALLMIKPLLSWTSKTATMISRSFEPYYKDTVLFETISPSDIRDLDREIDAYEFLDADDIDEFNTYLYKENALQG